MSTCPARCDSGKQAHAHNLPHTHPTALIDTTSRYIQERDLDWSYWPLDGQQGPSRKQGAVETYGLLNATWDGWAYPPLLEQLQALM